MCWRSLDEKVKKMTACDIACIKTAVFFFTLIVVKMWPGLLNIPFWLLIVLVLIFSWKPVRSVWGRK